MTAAAVSKLPFANASPAELRDALIPEERAKFDEEFHRALTNAGETFRLEELDEVLDSARRRAVLVYALGADGYRKMLARAAHTKQNGSGPGGQRAVGGSQGPHPEAAGPIRREKHDRSCSGLRLI